MSNQEMLEKATEALETVLRIRKELWPGAGIERGPFYAAELTYDRLIILVGELVALTTYTGETDDV